MSEAAFSLLRWTARIAALMVAGIFVFFVAAEYINPHSGPPTKLREWVGIALMVLTVVGMLLAWKWELAGACVSLLSLAAFCILVPMNRYDYVIGVAAAPGILFLFDWTLRHFRAAPTEN